MRRVRIRADDKLSRHRIAFEHDRVADSFRSFAVGQLAMQTNAFALRKLALFKLQLGSQVEQAHLAFLLGEDFIEKSQVVAEEKYRAGIIHRGFFADKLIEEDRRHGRDVFVAEAEVGASESGVARLNGGNTDFRCTGGDARASTFRLWRGGCPRLYGRAKLDILSRPRSNHVLCQYLLRQRHRALAEKILAKHMIRSGSRQDVELRQY